MNNVRKVGLAAALVAASLGAGIGLASAQTGGMTDTPSTTEVPVAGKRDLDCPEKGGVAGSSATDGSATATDANAIRLARGG